MAMVSFGAERKRGLMIGVAALLIVISIGTVIAWRQSGKGGMNGSVLIPAVVGITLLLRRTGGSIEYEAGQAEVVITRRSTMQAKVTRLAKSDIKALTVAPAKNVQQLRFDLVDGKHFVLLENPNERALEEDRKAVSDFVVANKLL